jgi:hypothetical protein
VRSEDALRKIFALSAAIITFCATAATGAQIKDLEAPLSISDFEFRYRLTANDEGRVYKVRVTNDMFRGLMRSYDADLAVFDSDGNAVPFVVRDARMPYPAEDGPSPAALPKTEVPLFPLPESGGHAASMMDVTIKAGEDGQVIEINGNGGETLGSGRLLADLSKVAMPPDGRPVTGYSLEIPLGGGKDMAAWVDVYASDNLRDWQQIAWKEPLIRLKRGDDLVTSGVIDLKLSGPARYLMLETGIRELPGSAIVMTVTGERETVIRHDSELFNGLPDDESRSVIYDTGGVFPASDVNFILETPGIYAASVSSRRDGEDEWRRHGEIHLSFIKNDAGESRNVPIQTRRINDRYWRLTPRDKLISPPPLMQMRWLPKELIFVAQGKPPYILAFGSNKDAPGLARPGLMEIALSGVRERDIPETAMEVAPIYPEPMPVAERDESGPEMQWTKYVVWAVLVGGALSLSWMAWSLLRKNGTGERGR